MTASLVDRIARLAPWWLLAHVATWPWRSVAEALLTLGAVLGFGLLVAARFRGGTRLLSHEAWALTSVLFIGYWLPQALSVLGAVDRLHSATETVKDLRYLPFLWFAAMAVATAHGRRVIAIGLAAIVAFWSLDALLQAITGTSIGGAPDAERLTGIFGAGNPKIGIVLASLSPFLLLPAARAGVLAWILVATAVGIVILLAGARAAWLTYAIVLLATATLHWGWKRGSVGVLAGGAVVVMLAATFSDRLGPRLERSMAALEMREQAVDFALSGRVVLWSTTARIIADHPLTGVGIDNYQLVYRDYAEPGDQFIESGRPGGYHAHQIVLEVLAETGVVGLLLWLAAVALAVRAWRFADPLARHRAAAPALALLVTVFPLNTHLAIYSTFWGGVTLLLAALFAGTLLARDAVPGAKAAAQ